VNKKKEGTLMLKKWNGKSDVGESWWWRWIGVGSDNSFECGEL